MRVKVSDFIADFFAKKGVDRVFTVVGGGAMHLNDSFGHNKNIKCLYNHHEQASAMAAEGYARVTNRPAIVCVTSGPGALNTLNGVAGAYQDSIPMIVISGQVKSTLMVASSGLPLRTMGGQEFDIVSAVGNMTKYAEVVLEPEKILYHLEKAYILATNGRPGPCWLDIPVDIQAKVIDTEKLESYKVENVEVDEEINLNASMEKVLDKLLKSSRPVFYAGNGIRLAKACDEFCKLVEYSKVPVVTCWDSIDIVDTENPYYVGRGGNMGDRPGNFAVQNSDMVIAIGNRLSIYQVGYDINTWAREAYVVSVDIDANELRKPINRIDLPICVDAGIFIGTLFDLLKKNNIEDRWSGWLETCIGWKRKYPVVQERQLQAKDKTNVYAFMDQMSRTIPEGTYTVVTNGSASVVGSQTYYIKKHSRFMMNCAISSMGYGVPAAIGAAVAMKEADISQQIVCIEGDGSIMMNLQELQTVSTNRLPIKLFVINNNGYHQIRLTQKNIFNDGYVGVGPASGDLGFPSFEKVADTFGLKYMSIKDNSEIDSVTQLMMNYEGAVLCEVFVDEEQIFEPKSAARKLDDGTIVSPPLEDMAPFLSREELKENMIITIES